MKVEYGIMSNKWSIEADDKLTAYATILISHYDSARLIALYSEECKEDSWLLSDDMEKRIGELFGGDFKNFETYVEEHKDEIRKAYQSIKKIV